MKHQILWLVTAILLLTTVPTLAQLSSNSPTETMRTANNYYEEGQFVEAVAAYETIIKAGYHNSDIYYNLGNAYFKQNELGQAILNYRRAKRLIPRDSDVTANLNISRSKTVDQLKNANKGQTGLVTVTEQWLTLNEAAVITLGLWLLICYFAVLSILVPKLQYIFKWLNILLVLFLVAGIFSITNRVYTEWQTPAMVIVAQEVDVTSGPGNSELYVKEFTIHSGTEIRLLESRPGWKRITLPGDLQGWIPAEAGELVGG